MLRWFVFLLFTSLLSLSLRANGGPITCNNSMDICFKTWAKNAKMADSTVELDQFARAAKDKFSSRSFVENVADKVWATDRVKAYKELKKALKFRRAVLDSTVKGKKVAALANVSEGSIDRAEVDLLVDNKNIVARKLAEKLDEKNAEIQKLKDSLDEKTKTIDQSKEARAATLTIMKGLLTQEIKDRFREKRSAYKNTINELKNNLSRQNKAHEKELSDLVHALPDENTMATMLEVADKSESAASKDFEEDFFKSVVFVDGPKKLDEQKSLIKYQTSGAGQIDWQFDQSLTPENYDAMLTLNDLSYAVAKELTVTDKKKLALVKERNLRIRGELEAKGWSNPAIFKGHTGRNNKNPDDTGVVSFNKASNAVVIAFHGSRSGSMVTGAFIRDDDGDWGANYDFEVVNGASEEAKGLDLPDYVEVHRGYAQNLRSAKIDLFMKVEEALAQLNSDEPIVVWVTGHSKGGAMALLCGPILKQYLSERARVFVVAFSAPKVFHGEKSREWAQNAMRGKLNILDIYVYGDPATHVPRSVLGYDYRRIGVIALDTAAKVDQRIEKTLKKVKPAMISAFKHWFGRLHYGFARDGGLGFEPPLVVTHAELLDALREGFKYLQQDGMNGLTQSAINSY